MNDQEKTTDGLCPHCGHRIGGGDGIEQFREKLKEMHAVLDMMGGKPLMRSREANGGLLSKAGAAKRLGLGIRGLEGLMARKALPFHRLSSRCVRFDPVEIDLFLERTKVEQAGKRKS